MDATIQTEKAYQRQPVIFLGNKKALLTKAKSGTLTEAEKKKLRYWKSVGLGFETPKAAIDGTYIDNYCPFTSNVSIRGKILRGYIKSNKMSRTIIMRRDYLKFVRKYNRYEKRHKNVPCHISPAFGAPQEGDQVIVGECRPISKTIRFNVLKVVPKGGRKKFSEY